MSGPLTASTFATERLSILSTSRAASTTSMLMGKLAASPAASCCPGAVRLGLPTGGLIVCDNDDPAAAEIVVGLQMDGGAHALQQVGPTERRRQVVDNLAQAALAGGVGENTLGGGPLGAGGQHNLDRFAAGCCIDGFDGLLLEAGHRQLAVSCRDIDSELSKTRNSFPVVGVPSNCSAGSSVGRERG